MWRICVLLVAVLLAGMTGCGGEDAQQTAGNASGLDSATEERLAALEAEADAARDEARRERARARRERAKARRAKAAARRQRAAERQAAPESEGGGGGGILVPDVVGLDHQAAQDAMQGEGLWLLDEKDCSGQGRVMLWDRNWEVVSTDPPAGTAVSEDTTVTLCSVKEGER